MNEIHRARTGITYPEQHFCWNERFDIDIYNASNVQFFMYSITINRNFIIIVDKVNFNSLLATLGIQNFDTGFVIRAK